MNRKEIYRKKREVSFDFTVYHGEYVGLPKKGFIPDGLYTARFWDELIELNFETIFVEKYGINFIKIPASELDWDRDYIVLPLPYTPRFKGKVEANLIKDFYIPDCIPSFNEDCTNICYIPNQEPNFKGKSFDWWNETAKNFAPEYNSHLGSLGEYSTFLASLRRKLMANGSSADKVIDFFNNVDNIFTKGELKTGKGSGICGIQHDFKKHTMILNQIDYPNNPNCYFASGDFTLSSHSLFHLVKVDNKYHFSEDYYNCPAYGWIVFENLED